MIDESSRTSATTDRSDHTGPRFGRRALLTGGLLGAGAVAGLAAAGPAEAVLISAGNVVFGPPPSGGDDTTRLNNEFVAMGSAGGTLILPPGNYKIAGQVAILQNCALVGSGGDWRGASTTITCTAASAAVLIEGAGAVTGSFIVDGGNIATSPLQRPMTPGAAVGRVMQSIGVINSAQDGLTILGAQNDAWYLLGVSAAARDCLVLDQGAGGILFSKCELTGAGRYNVRLDNQVTGGPYPNGPGDNLFHHCIFERDFTAGTGNTSIAYVNSSTRIKFDHCAFYSDDKTTGPTVYVTGSSSEIVFEDPYIQTTAGTKGGYGIQVDFGCNISVLGMAHFQNFDSAVRIAKPAGAPATPASVDIVGTPLYYNCTNFASADATATATLTGNMGIESFVSHGADVLPIRSFRTTAEGGATALTYASAIAGQSYYLLTETAAGYRAYGSGSATPDVHFGRQGLASVGVQSTEFLVVGYGTTATRPAAGVLPIGALRFNTTTNKLETNNGTSWV